ncbi:TetR/AcrR family transcriptional regulator [Lactobacillus sp. Sy-1]|uniref:TetR/AcrR family transcriptional regulator n=1 Tax=Lactobacillus sp. Sy-1 TaxID=2109645 RepID=UPI001C585694|nr:TetR/AcrR family transcriptional regulator [Lactobacillus sp. Sy-1]MBW1605147.1 TetR/AcrR family transcriptional regulator [Lactobacillus sp. Sy-1]
MNKSKQKILNAFLSLINQKSVLEITNIDIINESGVAKGTFYHNFHSKDDIIKYSEMKIDRELVHSFVQKYRDENLPPVTPEVFVKIFCETAIPLVYEYRDQIRILHGSDVHEVWRHYLEVHYFRIMKKLFPEDNNFNIRLFIKYVNLVVAFWISNLIPMDQEDFQRKFMNLINNDVLDLPEK